MTMGFNKNFKELTLIQSDKTSQPTLPSSILTTTGGKGKNHGQNGFNQRKNDKGKETAEGKQEQQNTLLQLKTPPRKTKKTTQSRSGVLDLKVTNNFRKSVGSKNKNNKNKNNKQPPMTSIT